MKGFFGKLNTTRTLLNSVQPGLFEIYRRHASNMPLGAVIGFTEITRLGDQLQKIISGLSRELRPGPLGKRLDLAKREVRQVSTEDIELVEEDKFGQIILASQDEISVRYGEVGIAPSQAVGPFDLLKYELIIPRGSLGVLKAQKHLPFLIEAENPQRALAISTSELTRVCEHEENIRRYSLDIVCELSPDDAKRLNLALQRRIFHDYDKETFYEEITSKVYKPTKHNRSSGTLMNFESEDYSQNNATSSYYHPGERSLHILTTKKPAGVRLNFCGIAENPNEREDCEVRLSFPPNSLVILNFPPYTHHQFYGDFVCNSVHPREGINLIEAVQSGTLPRGFLESATVFSETKENQKWNLSLPEQNDLQQSGRSR